MKGRAKIIALSVVLVVVVFMLQGLMPWYFGVMLDILCAVVVFLLFYLGKDGVDTDVLSRLHASAKRGFFEAEINALTMSYTSIKSWEEHAFEYDEDSSIRKSYSLIASRMNNILESSIKYIKTYDYITRPRPQYLVDRTKESVELVKKLHELQELIIKVEDSTSDVDVTYVDDMLDALRQMQD